MAVLFGLKRQPAVKRILCLGYLLGLLGCLCAGEVAPLRVWVVRSEPFDGSVAISIPKLQLEGHTTAAPILRFDVIDSVTTTESTSRITRVDKDGTIREEPPKKYCGVRIILKQQQAKLVTTLMRIHSGERLLWRRGNDPIAMFYILGRKRADGTLDVMLQDAESRSEGFPMGWAVDGGTIELPRSSAGEAETLRAELARLVKADDNDTKRGADPAEPPAARPPSE